MMEFLSNYWYYIVIYLSGCLVNYLLCREHFDFLKDSDNLIAAMILLPFYMIDMIICAFFITFSWVGTVMWCIIKLIDKYSEI
jgi:hypothetical protein